MARASKTTLSKAADNGDSFIFPDLRRNVFSLSPLSMMLAIGLSHMAFTMVNVHSGLYYGECTLYAQILESCFFFFFN